MRGCDVIPSTPVTDTRILIARGPGVGAKSTSLERAVLPEGTLFGGEARGGVRFGPAVPLLNMFSGLGGAIALWVPSLDPTPQFLAIQRPRVVFDLLTR